MSNSNSENPLHTPLSSDLDLERQKIDPIKKQLQEVRDITAQNIDKVLERGEKIDILVDNSAKLQNQSYQFQKSSRRLKNTMHLRKFKCYFIISSIIGLFIYFIASIICGNASLKHCK